VVVLVWFQLQFPVEASCKLHKCHLIQMSLFVELIMSNLWEICLENYRFVSLITVVVLSKLYYQSECVPTTPIMFRDFLKIEMIVVNLVLNNLKLPNCCVSEKCG
jgi:hypothetical protein